MTAATRHVPGRIPTVADRSDATSIAPQRRWNARLDLRLFRTSERTVLRQWSHDGPLYVQRCFHPEQRDCCHVYVLHPPGGIAGGDHLEIVVDASTDASTLVTTPAATKVYRSGGHASAAHQRISVSDGASVEWLPQETICHSGAEVDLRTRVELAWGARFLGWEILCLGLPHSRDPFCHGQISQRFEVHREGRPIFSERMRLRAADAALGAAWGLQGRTTTGTLVCALPPRGAPTSSGRDLAHDCVDAIRARLAPRAGELATVSRLDEVIVCRYLGGGAQRAREVLASAWNVLRPAMLDAEACPPRIWNT